MMEEMFALRAKQTGNSDLAELFKLSERPDVISFAGGFPDPQWFLPEVEEIGLEILRDKRDVALQYSPVPGLTRVREFIARRMDKQGMPARTENIMITSGSLQGLDLICKVFLDPGDLVVVEAPTYLGAISVLDSYEAEIVSIPCDSEGLMVDKLEEYLAGTAVKPKFVYTIPTFQNPSGRVLNLERRKKLVELCSNRQIPLIEDNAYGELRYSGKELPTLKSLDARDIVVYLGTFSKIFSPGVRLGWISAPGYLINKLILFKQSSDQTSSSLSQLLALEAGTRGLIEKQIEITRKGLKLKRDLTVNALEKYFGDNGQWTVSEGGFYTWVQINGPVDTYKALEPAVKEHKVAYVAGRSFYPDRSGENCLRVCFSLVKEDYIEEGIKRLARVFSLA